MNNFIYAINKSFEEMKKVVNTILNKSKYEEEERQKLFFCIGTCIHWILDYAERIEINESDKQYISAFRYINNSLKHAFEVKEISAYSGGITYPIEFPLEIPEKQIVWSVADNGKSSQRNNYKEILSGKNVVVTCENAIEILMRYQI